MSMYKYSGIVCARVRLLCIMVIIWMLYAESERVRELYSNVLMSLAQSARKIYCFSSSTSRRDLCFSVLGSGGEVFIF